MFQFTSCNLLLWSLCLDLCATAAPPGTPKETSWRNRNLSSVPLDLDLRLRRLDLSNNFIRQLHTLGLPILRQLDLSSNQLDLISARAFEELAELEELNLSKNVLNNNFDSTGKALQSISTLRSLDVSLNGLSEEAVELFLQNKPSLHHLSLAGNSLTRLTRDLFKQSPNLRVLNIQYNLLRVIEHGTFEPLRRLETLNLAKNNLPHICDFTLRQVKYLNLSHNSLEFFVTHKYEQPYRLQSLDLSFNKLLYFPVLPPINSLASLRLQHNMIGSSASEATMILEADSFYSDVTGEENKHWPGSDWGPTSLSYVDLSHNHFRYFPLRTLSHLSSLETLNFSFNCVSNITWNVTVYNQLGFYQISFSSLRYLDLQSNGLEDLSHLFLRALTGLETLNLRDNSIRPCSPKGRADDRTPCVSFGQLRTLKHLNLQENKIQALQPNVFEKTSLVSLNLAGNPHLVMKAGAFQGVQRSLQSLIISEINMKNADVLPCLPALTHLNMSNNRVHSLPGALMCSTLREIDIRNNVFVSLNYSLIENMSPHLSVLYIGGNELNCCHSNWLKILRELKITLPDINQTACLTASGKTAMTAYLENPAVYCFSPTKAQKNNSGQIIIIALFVAVMLISFVTIIRQMCCEGGSYVV